MYSVHYTDTELLKLFKDGDLKAFNTMFDRYWSSLYNVAFRILEDRQLSKDVVQEVFISFYEKAATVKVSNLHGYLYQAVKYQCFMQLRAGKISDKHLQRLQQVMVTNAIEDDLQAEELQRVLNESLATLPPKCREVFYLSRYESLSNKKIAEKLNISHKTVENQITKALKVLRTSVDKLAMLILLGWL
ncbi:MAG TPA: RNA polymerase sigma-70 factor [Ohtaekwangia sp.]|nr:RNA polymerase sigma-70 factor [Ohtaekwangia sp.]